MSESPYPQQDLRAAAQAEYPELRPGVPGPAAAAAGAPDVLAQALARIEQLEAALKSQTAPSVGVPVLTGPTHDLYLADGTHVEHTGALPTQVSFADGRILPVLAAVARAA